MQYVDSSALVKLYVREPESPTAAGFLSADPEWVTAAHTDVEVRRTLSIRLRGRALSTARAALTRDQERSAVVALDATTCSLASSLAESTGARTLDALHLAAAMRAGAPAFRFVTFDVRQARIARSLGWPVVGA